MKDEPVLNKVDFEKSREGYALMKKLDPAHPILVNHWPNPKYITFDDIMKWSVICGINGFDFYPVPLRHWEIKSEFNPDGWKHSIGIMGRFTDRWYKAAPNKPVVVVLQVGPAQVRQGRLPDERPEPFHGVPLDHPRRQGH